MGCGNSHGPSTTYERDTQKGTHGLPGYRGYNNNNSNSNMDTLSVASSSSSTTCPSPLLKQKSRESNSNNANTPQGAFAKYSQALNEEPDDSPSPKLSTPSFEGAKQNRSSVVSGSGQIMRRFPTTPPKSILRRKSSFSQSTAYQQAPVQNPPHKVEFKERKKIDKYHGLKANREHRKETATCVLFFSLFSSHLLGVVSILAFISNKKNKNNIFVLAHFFFFFFSS
eukprot:PhF_6_TR20784/c0_g1_i3/m.29839